MGVHIIWECKETYNTGSLKLYMCVKIVHFIKMDLLPLALYDHIVGDGDDDGASTHLLIKFRLHHRPPTTTSIRQTDLDEKGRLPNNAFIKSIAKSGNTNFLKTKYFANISFRRQQI